MDLCWNWTADPIPGFMPRTASFAAMDPNAPRVFGTIQRPSKARWWIKDRMWERSVEWTFTVRQETPHLMLDPSNGLTVTAMACRTGGRGRVLVPLNSMEPLTLTVMDLVTLPNGLRVPI